jgi:hypothetical protein
MIDEAKVDAYGESEQIVGFLTMLEVHLKLPLNNRLGGNALGSIAAMIPP